MLFPDLLALFLVWQISLPALVADAAKQPAASAPEASHWSFVPVVRPPVPVVRDASRVRTEVDHFIVAALERKGLVFAPESSKAMLVRRLCFDLTGLPPGAEEIAAFVNDQSSNAYDRLVERLLAEGHSVSVLDEFNDFYDPKIKRQNLAQVARAYRVEVLRDHDGGREPGGRGGERGDQC